MDRPQRVPPAQHHAACPQGRWQGTRQGDRWGRRQGRQTRPIRGRRRRAALDARAAACHAAARAGGAAAARIAPPADRLARGGGVMATVRRGREALPPRALRRLLTDLQEVVAPQVSEHEGGRRAQAVAAWYAQAEPGQRRDMWLLMCEQFAPDATRFESARQRYEAAAGTD